MRRLLAPCAAVAALLGFAGPAGAADELRLAKAGEPAFPDRAFILSAPPGATFDPADVRVYENGERVTSLDVLAPDKADASQFATVLVIDASRSMRGRPIRRAMAAARAFAEQRAPEQPLAVVTFNDRPSVLLPLTTDADAIERALSAPPPLGRETHVYDATVAGADLLEQAGTSTGSVVVLSDGGDTGSRATAQDAAAAAGHAGNRVFTVGLKSRAFNGTALSRLADAAGGRFSTAASPEDLEQIYSALGSELASEYLIRYRSYAEPGRRVWVEARIDGVPGRAMIQYVAPRASGSGAPFERKTFWTSAAPLVFVSLLCALPFGLVALAVLGPTRRRLPDRLQGFVATPESSVEDGSASLPGQMLAGAERSLEGRRWWQSFKEDLEIAQVRLPAIQVLGWTAVGTVLAAWLLVTATGAGVFALLAFLVPLGVRTVISQRLRKQRRLFAEQLAENVQVVASALRAGHSLSGALAVVADEATEPSRGEFQRIVAEERLGVPIEGSLEVVARRMGSRDLRQVAVVASLQRETGGNTAEVLDRVAETVRGRFELRRMIDSLTAQGRLTRWVLTFLPVGLLMGFTVLRPDYISPLFTTPMGQILLVVSVVMITVGSLIMKRIVNIKL